MSFLNKKRLIILSVLVVALGSSIWITWAHPRPDPQVEAVKALIPKDISKIPQEDRRETFQKIREATSKLSPQQRSEVFQDRRQKMADRLREYSKLPKKEQIVFLDKEIDRFDEIQKRWKKGSTTQTGQKGKQDRQRDRRNMSSEERENRKRNRLDSTTPEDRALFTKFVKDMRERRKERGLPPLEFPRPRFRGT